MKPFRRVVAFVVFPVLGYLLGATLFYFFADRVEPGDTSTSGTVLVATSCERRGLVTYKGFGYWHECRITLGGHPATRTVGFLRPEQIGQEIAVSMARHSEVIVQERPYVPIGVILLFPFIVLWALLIAWVAPERQRKRRMPVQYVAPS
ncbi:MAG: DUF6346 domain-containing protein [Umezawaea sp.]